MTINFKNRFIFFALATIWNDLNYKFRSQVNALVSENPDENFVQSLNVPEDILIRIYEENSKRAQGQAKYINVEMQAELVPQLIASSNIQAVQRGEEEPNEGSRILIACQKIDAVNAEYREAYILQGKNLILE